MRSLRIGSLVMAALLTVGIAGADVRVVTKHHQDGFAMMGQTQPPTDEEHVTWIGDDRLRMDQGSTSTVVDLGASKMLVINHDKKSYFEVELPVDLTKLMPPGMAEQMMKMMTFEATVTPTGETKKVGSWNASRYDMTLTSPMVTMEQVIWASTETPVDSSTFIELYSNVVSLQPGMEAITDEMRKIDGYVVSQEATMTMTMMGETTIGSNDQVISIDELDAPAGTYGPPADYSFEEFNFMEMMQQQ